MYSHVVPHLSNIMYMHVTFIFIGDLLSSKNSDQAVVEERIDLIIDTQDPEIVDDLWHHNPGRTPSMRSFGRNVESISRRLSKQLLTTVDMAKFPTWRKPSVFKICLSRLHHAVHKVPKFHASSGYVFSFG